MVVGSERYVRRIPRAALYRGKMVELVKRAKTGVLLAARQVITAPNARAFPSETKLTFFPGKYDKRAKFLFSPSLSISLRLSVRRWCFHLIPRGAVFDQYHPATARPVITKKILGNRRDLLFDNSDIFMAKSYFIVLFLETTFLSRL